MRFWSWVGLACAILLIGLQTAAAQTGSEPCFDVSGRYGPDDKIAGCTRLIDSGGLTGQTLATAYYNRGNAHGGKGDLDRAIADYDQALRLNPQYASAYYNRGEAYREKGDQDRAIADFDQALRINPADADTYNNRGIAYRSKGDPDRAIADYDQALRLTPQDAEVYNNRGNAYGAKGDHDRAIADYDQAIRLNPQYAHAYYNRGLAHERKGDHDRAIADYDQALRIDPTYASARRAREQAVRAEAENAAMIPEGPPIVPVMPVVAKGSLADAVLRRLPAIPEYRALSALYDAKQARPGWTASAEGRAVARQLNLARADAAATAVHDGAVVYRIGGARLSDHGIRIADLSKDAEYRAFIVDVVATNIMSAPPEPIVKAALERFQPADK